MLKTGGYRSKFLISISTYKAVLIASKINKTDNRTFL